MAERASFGKYKLIAELGSGGMAEVFLAVSAGPAGFGKLLVVKQLRKNLAEDPDFVTMFMDEARLAARLNHPNIVQTNDVGHFDGTYYIAMEFLDGQALNRLIRRADKEGGDPFPVALQLLVCADVLAGLHYAHELKHYDGTPLNIVHRDISPHNVFITYEGSVKVVDFGIAKASGRAQETAAGVLKGKVRYMGPEQALNVNVDRRADIFCVGIMVWEAITGKRFWSNELNEIGVIQKLLGGDYPTSPKTVKADVPDELDAICRKALSHVPGERYATALDMQQELERYLNRDGKVIEYRRDLGPAVARMFADDREYLRALTNEQLAKLEKSSDSISVVKLAESVAEGSVDETVSASDARFYMSKETVGPPSRRKGEDAPASGSASAVMLSPAVTGEIATKRRGRGPALAIAAVAMIALGGGAFVLKSSKPSGNVVVPTPPPPAPTASAAGETHIVVHLSAPYPSAVIVVDGVQYPSVYHGELISSTRRHSVRVEAPGYAPLTSEIVFDRDLERDLHLEPISSAGKGVAANSAVHGKVTAGPTTRAAGPTSAASVVPPPVSTPPPTSPTDKAPTAGGKKRGQLDQSNPYGE